MTTTTRTVTMFREPDSWCTLISERGEYYDLPRRIWCAALPLAWVGGWRPQGTNYRVGAWHAPVGQALPFAHGAFFAFAGEAITEHDARGMARGIRGAFARLASEKLDDRGLMDEEFLVEDARLSPGSLGRGWYQGRVFRHAFDLGYQDFSPYHQLADWLDSAGAARLSPAVQPTIEYR